VLSGHMFFHFTPARGSLLLWNARLGKGTIATISTLSQIDSRFITSNDVNSPLREFEGVLEAVRSSEFQNQPSRRGALFAFDTEETCRKYASRWYPDLAVEVVRFTPQAGAIAHKGHLSWLSEPPRESWQDVARAYWSGVPGQPPHDWEYVFNGNLYFPDWASSPFGRLVA
jgi:hypothetical protein